MRPDRYGADATGLDFRGGLILAVDAGNGQVVVIDDKRGLGEVVGFDDLYQAAEVVVLVVDPVNGVANVVGTGNPVDVAASVVSAVLIYPAAVEALGGGADFAVVAVEVAEGGGCGVQFAAVRLWLEFYSTTAPFNPRISSWLPGPSARMVTLPMVS